ncbi:hypothetical protein [Sphingomonas sp.]|uniref:hypothetical protein n=1 Tax=Sphingomonas sp. TaxID=28214 RepID=UPI003B005603
MTRARVFVLREKQAEVLSAGLSALYNAWISTEDGPDDLAARQAISTHLYDFYDVLYSPEQVEDWESAELLAASVARVVLTRDPPNTKPPWNALWV